MTLRRLAGTLAIAAFTGAATAAEPPPASNVAADPRVVSALELARTWLEAQRAYERIPGVSAAIVHDQATLWSGGFGQSDLASGRAATADTLYSICSISKLFTSIAVMQQRDAGALRLEDPVGKYLPWFRLSRPAGEGEVTIEGVLTHASGLPQEPDYPYWTAPTESFPTREEIVAVSGNQAALYAPELHYQYSNLGFTLAGEVVAATSGMPYAAYVEGRILRPLGLSDTTPDIPASERGKRLATGYSARDREGRRAAVPLFDPNAIAAAAGFASNVGDLGRFASWQFRLLENGGTDVLKATTLREMQRIHWAEPDLDTLRGLGFNIWRSDGKTFVGHDGSCPGYRTALLMSNADRIATVFMANAQSLDVQEWAQRLYDIVAPAVQAAVKEPGAGKAPDPSLRVYAGVYDPQPWAGEVAVLPWEDGLAMVELPTMNPLKGLEKFRKIGENRFRRIRKDGTLGEEVVFTMGPDGRPTRFTQHNNHLRRVR
jgi:CubicO group peptidase (beta-lactamase class C family)